MTVPGPAHTTPARVELLRFAVDDAWREQLVRDVEAGLSSPPYSLPPKYFYDARGSQLFEDITGLDEYYQTRAETSILERIVDPLAAAHRPVEVVELGSGSSRKTRLLLEAVHRGCGGHRYVPLDVSEDALQAAARELVGDYEWLDVCGVVGDFDHHLHHVPRTGPGIVAFLGSTIGNLTPPEQAQLLGEVAASLRDDDVFLLGADLVPDEATGKSVGRLVSAYDDAAGVTAEFNRNVLLVLQRELGAEVDVDAFAHEARYNPVEARIEMHLRAEEPTAIRIPQLGIDAAFASGETLMTEISCKFTRQVVAERLAAAGLELAAWEIDAPGWFALAIARPAPAPAPHRGPHRAT